MRASLVPVLLLLSVCVLQVPGFEFPNDDRWRVPALQPRQWPCLAADGSEGRCVSLLSGSCLLYSNTAHLLLRKPNICSLTFRDAIVCCPIAALRGMAIGRTPRPPTTRRTTPAPFRPTRPPFRPIRTTRPATAPPAVPFRPTRPHLRPIRTTRPVTAPPVVTRPPPRRVTTPTSPRTRPTNREPLPTSPPGPVSSTRDLNSPIGLRPRPSVAPIVEEPRRGRQRGFRQPDCGVSRPIAAFHSGDDYFQHPPQFVRSERVLLGLHPWTAMVGLKEPASGEVGRWICAGALLTPRIVLSSAQCVLSAGGPEQLMVGLGEHDLASRTDGVAGLHPVLAVEWHPEWAQLERRHSLAVLLLSRPADQSPLIQPVCLPPPDPAPGLTPLLPAIGSSVVEVAYDLDSTGMDDASARDRLEATAARVAPIGACVAALEGAPLTELLFPGGPQPGPELCLAAGPDCRLDVGAPVVAAAEDGTVQLEGLQLLDNCAAGKPRLLLRVRHYVPFIAEAIEKLMERLTTNPF